MSVTTCMAELEKLSHKLQRAYKRRDHYAQLYYRTMAELEDTKWELDVAKNKIKELQSQGNTIVLLAVSIIMCLQHSI